MAPISVGNILKLSGEFLKLEYRCFSVFREQTRGYIHPDFGVKFTPDSNHPFGIFTSINSELYFVEHW